MEITILYQDDHLVAVSKPGGLLCHRSRESLDRVFLLQEVRDRLERFVYPVHRIDRAASGIVLFALSSSGARMLQQSLGQPETRKVYLVLVRGETSPCWQSHRPLTSDNGVRKEAHTFFEKLAAFSRLSLLRARITTGRRHQIRRHLAHAAHQVLGDTTYGKGRINEFFRKEYGLPRMFLHAGRLELRHPATGAVLHIHAPLPGDLRGFLERLPDVPPGLLEEL